MQVIRFFRIHRGVGLVVRASEFGFVSAFCVVKTLRPLARIPATRIGSGNLEIIAADAMAFLANEGAAPFSSKYSLDSCGSGLNS